MDSAAGFLDEGSSLQALKDQAAKGMPTLEWAMAVQNHLDRYRVSQRQLANQLEMDSAELSRLLALRKWPQEIQDNLAFMVLSARDIQALSGLKNMSQLTRASRQVKEKQIPSGKIFKFCEDFQKEQDPPDEGGDSEEPEESRGESSDTPMDRLRRMGKRRTPGGQRGGPGGFSPKTSGGRRTVPSLFVSVFLGFIFGPLYLAAWLLSPRAYRDLGEMEERLYNWAEAKGAERVLRWILIILAWALLMRLFWPRIKEGVDRLRHPKVSSSQPGAPAPTPASGQGETSGTAADQNGGVQRDTRNGGNPVTVGKGGPITGNHSPTLRPSRPDSSPMANSTGSPYTPRVSGRPNGIPAVTGSSAAPPIPTNVHVVVESPDIIRISWRAVGPKITYNFYSCATSQMSPLRKENDRPINGNVIEWTPETGLDGYWIVVSAVDARGNESNYSEAVEVIRHPQQAPSAMRKALDKAADELQQRLP